MNAITGAADAVLSCEDVSRWFGGLQALKNVSIGIRSGEIYGLVGPNGSGKTTLVNAITGFYPPQTGRIRFETHQLERVPPHRVAALGIARTFQNVALFKGMSALDNILVGRHVHMRPSALASLFYWVWAEREEVRNRKTVEEIIDLLQLQSVRHEPVEMIPLGMQKRVELARALAAEPRLLILDEPMAGMNQEEKEYMVRFILDARDALNLSILLIEHHLDVVAAICERVAVLNNGEKIAEDAAGDAMRDPDVVAAYIGKVEHAG
ncbi:MAG: ABC transporter ATP-binding protein [Dichotomicrobium sp.]